jgi:hypothetical protein
MLRSTRDLVRLATRGRRELLRGPRPPSAPSWTSTWLDGSRTGSSRSGRAGPRPADKKQSGPRSAQWSSQPRRPADADPFRAQSLRDGPCRHLPDQLAPGRQVEQRHGGQCRRRAAAQAEKEGACACRPRGGEAHRHRLCRGSSPRRGSGRPPGGATRRAANGKCIAATALGYFHALGELFSCSVMNSDAEAGIGVHRLAHS